MPMQQPHQQQQGQSSEAVSHCSFPEFITPPTMNRDAKSVAIVTPDCETSSHKLSAVSTLPHNAATQGTHVARVTPLTQHSLALNHANVTNNLNFTHQSFQGANNAPQRERAQAAPAQIHRPPMHRIGQRVALSQRLKQCAQVSPAPSPSSSFPSSSFPAASAFASTAAVICPEVVSRHSGNYEIFVGDLSFFCTEMDLYELFCPFGQVLRPRIRRSDKDSRTLMYGFVEMPVLEEAEKAVRELDGSRFQGRDIRVEISRSKAERNESFQQQQQRLRNKIREKDVQVHVTLTSQFQHNQVVKPKEDLLRTIFEEYGAVRDIAIKEYTMNKDLSRQEGFLFVSFPSLEDATRAVENLDKTSARGFLFRCSLSHSNPFDPAHARTPQTNNDLSNANNKGNINNNDNKTDEAEIALSGSIDSNIDNDNNGVADDNNRSIGDNAGNNCSGDVDKNAHCVDVNEFTTEGEALADKVHSVTDKSSSHSEWSSSCPSPSRPLRSSPQKHTHANTLTQTRAHTHPHPTYSSSQQTHTHPLHTHSSNNANSVWAQQRGRDRANDATRLFSPATRYNYPGSSPVPVMSNLAQSMSALSVSGYSPHTSYSQFAPHAPGMSPSHARSYAPPPNSPLTQHVHTHTVSPLLPHAHCPPMTLPYNAHTHNLRTHSNHTPTLPYAPPMVSPLTPSAITPTLSYATPSFNAPTQQQQQPQALPYSVPPYYVPYAPPQSYADINGNSVQFSPYPPALYPYPPRSVPHPPY